MFGELATNERVFYGQNYQEQANPSINAVSTPDYKLIADNWFQQARQAMQVPVQVLDESQTNLHDFSDEVVSANNPQRLTIQQHVQSENSLTYTETSVNQPTHVGLQ